MNNYNLWYCKYVQFERRLDDDPCPYLLAIWSPGINFKFVINNLKLNS